jgi:hypoxanthine-guanine phosphoribosyltransferase
VPDNQLYVSIYLCPAVPPIVVCPADLAREISKDLPDVKVDFLRASSYGTASESSGNVQVKTTSDLGRWEEYHILLVSACFTDTQVVARTSLQRKQQ